MHKLMILFRLPADVYAMERLWSERFVPLAEKMPGICRVAVSRVRGSPEGQADVFLVHEFFFEDEQALQQAMVSPEGQAAGQALMAFAAGQVSLYFAEHMEEERLAAEGASPAGPSAGDGPA